MGIGIFLQQFINGVTLGAIYGLIAIGYTMVFGIIRMVNFAHGDLFMVSAVYSLIAFMLLTTFCGFSASFPAVLLAMLFSILLAGMLNWTIERVAYRPLRTAPRLAPLISALGVSHILENLVAVTQGYRDKSIPSIMNRIFSLYDEGGYVVTISGKQIFVIGITIVLLVVFWAIVTKTALGRAQRACAQDRTMAMLLGVDVDKIIPLTFVIGAVLAAVAGTISLFYYGSINPHDGFNVGIRAFAAATLGGIGSLPGAVLGGLIIGLVEALFSLYSNDYKDLVVFSILILILTLAPHGLLGRSEIEKV